MGTIASVTVTPGSGVRTGGGVFAVTAGLESVDVENAAVKAGVSVGAGGAESAPKTAPTIVKFAIVLAARELRRSIWNLDSNGSCSYRLHSGSASREDRRQANR